MVDKKRLLAIEELNITAVDDGELEGYMVELFFFCDTLPSHKESINMVLKDKHYEACSELLDILKAFLTNIHTVSLAGNCDKIINALKETIESGASVDHEKLEEEIEFFFAELDTLFIDILIAGTIVQQSAPAASEKPPVQAEAELPAKDDGSAPKKPSIESANILAVDDAKFYLNTLKLYFQHTKHNLICMETGEDVLDHLAQPDEIVPDLFLLDTDLPGISGYELAQEIRAAGLTAPMVFLVGEPSKKIVIKALEAGGIDLIVKSSGKQQILERVQKHL